MNWQQPLFKLSTLTLGRLRLLPADLTVSQLWPYLQSQSEQQTHQESETYNLVSPSLPTALVNKKGGFSGLLDSWRLLEFICTAQSQKQKLGRKNCLLPRDNSTEIDQKLIKEQDFSPPTKEDLQLHGIADNYNYISSLIELLEKLPLPLMLKSNDGQVLNQNLAWRSQIEQELELMEIADTVASLSVNNIQKQQTEAKIPDSLSVLRDTVTLSCPATTNRRFSPTTLLQKRAKLP